MSTEDLLDATLDDIDDLPSFAPFAPGVTRVLATWDLKEIANHGMSPELSFKAIEKIEYADPSDAEENPTNEGDTCNTIYFLDNDIGAGKFKAIMSQFAEGLGLSGSNRELIEQITDAEVLLVSGVRPDKNDTTRFYLDVHEIGVVG